MNLLLDQVLIILVAVVIDLAIGDPPEKYQNCYPIVWISKIMYFFDNKTKRGDPIREKVLGVTYCLILISIFSIPCLLLYLLSSEIIYILLSALIFKMTFTISGLEKYARSTMTDNIEEKRTAVSKIVSRDTADLNEYQLNSATIESLAENLTDSFISPLFYFVLFGLFGAMVYRVVNTLDAVVGYKNKRYINIGWFSARLDDLLNYIPKQVSSFLIYRGKIPDKYVKNPVKKEIVAISYKLKVNLEKKDHYIVGEEFEGPKEEDIKRAISIVKSRAIVFTFISMMALLILYLGGWTWLNREVLYLI